MKVLAAERDTTMQALVEVTLRTMVEGNVSQPAAGAEERHLQFSPQLERVVGAFVEFWQHPKSATDRQVRKLIEAALGLSAEEEK